MCQYKESVAVSPWRLLLALIGSATPIRKYRVAPAAMEPSER
jgi:hypothetical protein